MELQKQIEDWVTEYISSKSQTLFLVKVQVNNRSKPPKFTIWLEDDEGITIDTCAVVSRGLQKYLDEIITEYSLEVSSPGIGEPLLLKRQYKKNINRIISLKQQEQAPLKAKLIAVEEEFITVELQKNKKSKEKTEYLNIPFVTLIEVKVEIKI